VAGLLPGAKAHVEVVRNQQRMVVEVALSERRDQTTLASLPQSRSEAKLGLDVQDLNAALAEKFKLHESRGVLVTKVETGSLAQSEGLREGDLIKEVNRVDVGTVGDFTAAVGKIRRGDTLLLRGAARKPRVLRRPETQRALIRFHEPSPNRRPRAGPWLLPRATAGLHARQWTATACLPTLASSTIFMATSRGTSS
jgi:predicted metalloprotease with PDZ domain